MAISNEAKIGIVAGLLIAVALTTGPPFWFKYLSSRGGPAAPRGVSEISGGCKPFQVFAQNRYNPVGTSVRAEPNVLSEKVGDFGPNESISVNGWVHGRPAYSTNPAPLNNDVWYHLANNQGWVSFAGVRAAPVGFDPTGLSPVTGPLVAISPSCEGAVN